MIFEILLSIVVTFGAAQGPTGSFNECPAAGEGETVATSQNTTSINTSTTADKKTKQA